ncbi:MAG: transglycosylase SLT domain-containing protein [Burkholderiales bacterium]
MRPSLRTTLIAALLASAPARADLGSLLVSANEGDAAAQLELASKYENSEGVERDYAAAAELYCRAAKQGSVEAKFKLGWMYANARGVARDDALAAYWFNAAAEQGHEYAQRMLQFMPPASKTPVCLLEPSVEENVFIEDLLALDLSSSGREDIVAIVRDLAPQYSVDPGFALAIIAVESNFKAAAVSHKNAQGLMQLIPDTQRRFQVKNAFNPVDNIKGGLAYLQWLLAFFKGNVALVAAAYNAGERAVERYRGIPPFPETQNYVRKIRAIYKKSDHPYVADLTAPSVLAR